MEPLRKCQSAKQFRKEFTNDKSGSWNYSPCIEYPQCPYCPIVLSITPAHQLNSDEFKVCKYCHSERMTLYDVPTEKLLVPLITYDDFLKALNKAHSSVGAEELLRFVSWTEEFGQDG